MLYEVLNRSPHPRTVVHRQTRNVGDLSADTADGQLGVATHQTQKSLGTAVAGQQRRCDDDAVSAFGPNHLEDRVVRGTPAQWFVESPAEDHEQVQIEGRGPVREFVLDLGGVPTREEIHVVEQHRNGLAAWLTRIGGWIQNGRLPKHNRAGPGKA